MRRTDNTFKFRCALCGLILLGYGLAYARGTGRLSLTQAKEKNESARHKNEGTAPDLQTLLSQGECRSKECMAAATLVESALRILRRHQDPHVFPEEESEEEQEGTTHSPTSDRLPPPAKRRHTRSFDVALVEVANLRHLLVNRDNGEYLWIDERIGKGRHSDYILRASAHKGLLHQPMAEVQATIDETCIEGICDLKANNDYLFAQTDLRNRRCGILSYPWYDAVSHSTILKRTIVYRWSEDILIGSGYSAVTIDRDPSKKVVGITLGVYALFLCALFVYPGLSESPVPTTWYWVSASVFIVLVMIYASQHATHIERSVLEDSIDQRTDNYYMWKNGAWIIAEIAILSLAFLFFFHLYGRRHSTQQIDMIRLLILSVVLCMGSGLAYVFKHIESTVVEVYTATLNLALLNLVWLFWNIYV